MTIKITYPKQGRGAWSTGMLNLSGTGDGPFYRAPATGSTVSMIGADVATKNASSKAFNVSINDYAVWRGAYEIQAELKRRGYNITPDGVWGPATDKIVKDWQTTEGIGADGIYGQQTARTMWEPVIAQEVKKISTFMSYLDPKVGDLVRGHMRLETNWDVAAVGTAVPQDLGIAQINGPAHTNMSVDDRLNPRKALDFAVDFVVGNLNWSGWVEDDAIACYNVGRGGAEQWVNAGRPATWAAAKYVAAVRANM